MTHVFRSFIVFLLILHVGALFMMVQNRGAKIRVRQFFNPFTTSQTPSPLQQKKPKIPLKILSPMIQAEAVYPAGQWVPLMANKPARWMVDQEWIGEGKTVFWPLAPGPHFVRAVDEDFEHGIYIFIK